MAYSPRPAPGRGSRTWCARAPRVLPQGLLGAGKPETELSEARRWHVAAGEDSLIPGPDPARPGLPPQAPRSQSPGPPLQDPDPACQGRPPQCSRPPQAPTSPSRCHPSLPLATLVLFDCPWPSDPEGASGHHTTAHPQSSQSSGRGGRSSSPCLQRDPSPPCENPFPLLLEGRERISGSRRTQGGPPLPVPHLLHWRWLCPWRRPGLWPFLQQRFLCVLCCCLQYWGSNLECSITEVYPHRF